MWRTASNQSLKEWQETVIFKACNFSGIIDIKNLPMLKRFDPDIPQLSLLSIPLAELQGVCQKELAKPGHFRYRHSTNWVTQIL